MAEEINNELSEKNSNQEPEKKKSSLFSKFNENVAKAGKWVGDQTKKAIDTTKDKIDEVKEKNAEKKALADEFKKNANKFYILYKDTSKKNKEILCIVDEANHILKTDYEIPLMNEVDCIQDSRKQGYYKLFLKSEKAKFTYDYNNKELSMDLYQITYTNEKPKQDIHNIINVTDNRIDNSINAGKGAIIGDNSSIKKETNFNIGVNIPKDK